MYGRSRIFYAQPSGMLNTTPRVRVTRVLNPTSIQAAGLGIQHADFRFSGTDSFTLCARILETAPNTNSTVFGIWNTATSTGRILSRRAGAGGYTLQAANNAGTQVINTAAAGTVANGQWATIVLTKTWNGTNTVIQLFVNGTLVQNQSTANQIDLSNASSWLLFNTAYTSDTSVGRVSSWLAVYNRVLSGSEITGLGNVETPTLPTTGLVGHWPFNDLGGWTATSDQGHVLSSYVNTSGAPGTLAPAPPSLQNAYNNQDVHFFSDIRALTGLTAGQQSSAFSWTATQDTTLYRLGLLYATGVNGSGTDLTTNLTGLAMEYRIAGGAWTAIAADTTYPQTTSLINATVLSGQTVEFRLTPNAALVTAGMNGAQLGIIF